MEQANINLEEGGGKSSNNSSSSSSSYLCRQSSTRWTPTSDQIRILKELYYNNGVRSPNAEQIQRISAKLRQYGKIEGKNVFYWFQNHKARERQKKRFTTTTITDHHHIMPMHYPSAPPLGGPNNINNNNTWKFNHHQEYPTFYLNNNFSNPAAGNFPSSSPTLPLTHGYGSVAMEKSFRECSITPSGNGGGQNFAWMIGVDPYPFLDQNRKYNTNTTNEMEDEREEEMETLPLFPMHGDNIIKQDQISDANYFITGCHDNTTPRASLELTLNSTYPTTS